MRRGSFDVRRFSAEEDADLCALEAPKPGILAVAPAEISDPAEPGRPFLSDEARNAPAWQAGICGGVTPVSRCGLPSPART